MQRRWFRTAVLVSCAVAAGWVSLHAQTHFASLTGAVTSSDGVSVPNVEVVATNQDTQVAYPATSNDQGIYTITAIAARHLRHQGPGADLPAFCDEPDQTRIGVRTPASTSR